MSYPLCKRLTLISVILVTALAFGQFAQRATLSGFVSDPSGALISGAQVMLKDIDRNQVTATQTKSAGRYEFTQLTFGNYEVQVTQTASSCCSPPRYSRR